MGGPRGPRNFLRRNRSYYLQGNIFNSSDTLWNKGLKDYVPNRAVCVRALGVF